MQEPALSQKGVNSDHKVSYLCRLFGFTVQAQQENTAATKKKINLFLLIAVLVIAFNLRTPIAGLGPLVDKIRATTGLSNSMLGLLTAIPMLAFGFIAAAASKAAKSVGLGVTIGLSLIGLVLGDALRSVDSVSVLYTGTIILGISIAFINVLLPSITKKHFESISGLMTGLYTGVMAIGSATAAGMNVPLSNKIGWHNTLGIWAIPAAIALILWLPYMKGMKVKRANGDFWQTVKTLTHNPLAWRISFFMGLQSWSAYIIMAWLPDMLQDFGYTPEFSGWMLSLSQASGIAGSLFTPLLTRGRTNQRFPVIVFCIMETIGLLGLLFFPHFMLPFWAFMIGFPLGAYFTLALLFLVLRSNSIRQTTQISSISQTFGYLLAAPAPILFGALFDITGSWVLPIISLLLVVIAKFYTGWGAGADRKL